MAHIGADNPFVSEVLDRTEIFTSHEALLLDYEEKLTRQTTEGWIDGSAHYVWVGERTRELDGAHIEFIRGIENPIGIKLGPSLEGEELIRLLDMVNPRCEVGKVTLISRYGHKNVFPGPTVRKRWRELSWDRDNGRSQMSCRNILKQSMLQDTRKQ
jgi:3-deoxy-7-phosphoheptulonate synthase